PGERKAAPAQGNPAGPSVDRAGAAPSVPRRGEGREGSRCRPGPAWPARWGGAAYQRGARARVAARRPPNRKPPRRRPEDRRAVCGDDLRYTSSQLGHEDVRFTMSVYAKASKRRERLSGPHLKAYDLALGWAQMGTNEVLERVPTTAEATKTPDLRGL